MNGNGFTRSRRPSKHTMGSCSCSVLVTRLSIICFLFLSVVLLLQVYEHRKRESQFLKRSIREYVHISRDRGRDIGSRSLSGKKTLVFSDSYISTKNVKLKMGFPATDKKSNQGEVKQQYLRAPSPPEMNATHINKILMEPVNAKYNRNIYFTVKTTHKYYTGRLFPLMLTWLQAVDRNKVSIISDKSQAPSGQDHVDTMRKAGFNIVDTDCSSGYSDADLSCKQGIEFGAYYNAVERHPGKEDSYAWYCHVDDDMYVNVPQLSQFLQQYDPHKPYYIGKWPRMQRGGEANIKLSNQTAYHMRHEANHTLKQMVFQYATGAIFCISYAIMMEAKKFFNGPAAYHETCALAHLPDDMTVGLTIGILLGYNLTEVTDMKNQYDSLYSSSLKDLTEYLTVSYSIAFVKNLKQFGSSLNTPQKQDPKWVFLLYHCLLYPTVSWCQWTTR